MSRIKQLKIDFLIRLRRPKKDHLKELKKRVMRHLRNSTPRDNVPSAQTHPTRPEESGAEYSTLGKRFFGPFLLSEQKNASDYCELTQEQLGISEDLARK